MNGTARMSLEISEISGEIPGAKEANERPKTRVHVFAENALLRERLLRSLESEQDFDAISENILEDAGERKFASNTFAASSETLVMSSCGVVFEDLRRVRQARKKTPGLKFCR